MNRQRHGGGPNRGFLLLIPAAVIIAKGMRHHRAMWESGWAPTGPEAHGPHPFARHGAGGPAAEDRQAFGLPPKVERMLKSWHGRAHQNAEAADTTSV